MFDCVLSAITIHDLPITIYSRGKLVFKHEPWHKQDMVFTAIHFPNGKRFIDDYSLLALEAINFSQEFLPPKAPSKH